MHINPRYGICFATTIHISINDSCSLLPSTMLRVMASTGIRIKGKKYVHHIPRDVQSTLFHLITGHAFTGAYRLKFKRPNLPPAMEEEVACACGAVPKDTEHVLLHCLLTHHHRCRLLFTNGPIDSLRKVFDHPMRCLGPPHALSGPPTIPRSHTSLR
jgi:hypothetical protein